MQARRPKVFIIGISGQLGFQLALRLREKFLVSGAYFANQVDIPDVQTYPISLKNLEVLETLIRIQAPDFTINAFGITDPKVIVNQEKLSENLNIMMAVSFAVLANKIKAKHVHLSCAEVYDGSDGNYQEDHADFTLVDPLGKQKIAAETYIRTQTLESTILRLGKVVGLGHPYRPSYFDRLRLACATRTSFDAPADKKHSFLSKSSFTAAVEQILLGEIPMKHRTFNLGGCTLSEQEFALGWAELMEVDPKFVKIPQEASARDLSMVSKVFAEAYPAWKPETRSELYLNLLRELAPAVGTKKWQKTLQTP